jgi:hypothetical protein
MPFNFSCRQTSSRGGGDDPVSVGITALAEYDDDHVPAAPEVSVPSRKQPGGVNASASSDDIRISNDLRRLVSLSRQQIWMSLLNGVLRAPG